MQPASEHERRFAVEVKRELTKNRLDNWARRPLQVDRPGETEGELREKSVRGRGRLGREEWIIKQVDLDITMNDTVKIRPRVFTPKTLGRLHREKKKSNVGEKKYSSEHGD